MTGRSDFGATPWKFPWALSYTPREATPLRRLAEAAALEREATATGDVALLAEAEALLVEPVTVAPVPVEPPTPKVEGVSYREVWEFEIVNEALIPREYLVPDLKRIGGVIRAMKGSAQIPGVRAYSRRVVAAGR